jgi:hypothetical protein
MKYSLAKLAGRTAWDDGLRLNDCPYAGLFGDAWREGWLERDSQR